MGDFMQPKQPRFQLKLALCISLFSFSNYVTQPIYSAFVPSLLAQRLPNTTQIGLVLSCCNLLAMLIHPVVGALSDRTRCRFGRRRPYILSGAVACGLCFALIPHLRTLASLSLVLALYSITVAYWRAPIGAIQIDRVAPQHITRSNAVASCMLALSSVLAYLLSNRLEAAQAGLPAIFMLGGGCAIVTALVGCLTVREEDSRTMALPKPRRGGGMLAALLTLPPPRRRAMLTTLGVVALAYLANSAFEYFFVLFSAQRMGLSSGQATVYLAVYMAAYLLMALLASVLPRVRSDAAMVGGAMGLAALAQLVFFALSAGEGPVTGWAWALCAVHGLCWGCFNIYMYPLWLRFNDGGCSGNLMGLFFVCTGLAAAAAPALYGLLHDWTGSYGTLFAFCGSLFWGAVVLLVQSRRMVRRNAAGGNHTNVV